MGEEKNATCFMELLLGKENLEISKVLFCFERCE